MAKTHTTYACEACGAHAPRWVGRCNRCKEFGTVVELAPAGGTAKAAGTRTALAGTRPARAARAVADVDASGSPRRLPTGVGEFDRVLGGGLVPGQVLLLAGEPGAGKSTLLLMVADAVARASGRTVLYCSGEESVHQIAVRARRVGALHERLLVSDDTDLGAVLGHVETHADDLALLIVDSVQTIASPEVEGRAGGVAQVMEVAQVLVRNAKQRGLPTCLVGQVTKESTVAGPRALEHTVDTTLSMEGDPHTALRLLRAVKNRYGPADEVACFEQADDGLREIPDPSALFRGQRDAPVPGTCVTVTVEGRRPLLAEVQCLVVPSSLPSPRRAVSGLDSARVAMLTAVTERHGRLPLKESDLFAATVGGIKLRDPGSDLAVCLALASAITDRPLPADVAAIGEVTLSGEVRPVPGMTSRVAEAARLGYGTVIVPPGTEQRPTRGGGGAHRVRLVEAASLGEALRVLPRRENS
ncbi:DNA repair protein RadA [Nocardioidaceae bacterium]|nr:DNA repair protein RadA [Nocardioidaceae bacterium]